MKSMKKIASVVIASAMLISMTGCDKANDQVLEAVDSFASAVKSGKYDKIAKLATDNIEDDEEALAAFLSFEYCSDNEVSVYSTIQSTIEYAVDEESVDASTKQEEGTVDVTFSMVDYEAVLEEDYSSVDDLIDALEESEDKTEVTVSVEFELDGEDWLVSNASEVIEKVYDFVNVEVPAFINPDDCYELWYGGDGEGNYVNAYGFDLDLGYYGDRSLFIDELYYTVELNGEVLYTSETGTYEGYFNESHGAVLNDQGYLDAGDYVITFYVGSTQIMQGTAHVTIEEADYSEFYTYVYYSDGYYNDSLDDHVYTDADQIDIDLMVPSGFNYSNVYYTVEYNGTLVYTSDTYERMGYYGASQGATLNSDGYLPAGTYTVSFYDGSEFIMSDSVEVVLSSEGGNTGSSDSNVVWSNDYIAFYDADLFNAALDFGWWDYDGTMTGEATFGTGTSIIAFSVEVGDDYDRDIIYTLYSVDSSFDIASGTEVYSAETSVTHYGNGTHFFDIDTPTDGLASGNYMLVVTDTNGTPLFAAICQYEA